jgi:hypothetical protein
MKKHVANMGHLRALGRRSRDVAIVVVQINGIEIHGQVCSPSSQPLRASMNIEVALDRVPMCRTFTGARAPSGLHVFVASPEHSHGSTHTYTGSNWLALIWHRYDNLPSKYRVISTMQRAFGAWKQGVRNVGRMTKSTSSDNAVATRK